MKNWQIDPSTGDYVMSGGAPVETASLQNPAYVRLKVKRKTWLYAPDEAYGSDLYLIKKRRTDGSQNSLVENTAARALQPLIDDGRASEINVTTTQAARNGVGLEVDLTDAEGNSDQISLNPIGP